MPRLATRQTLFIKEGLAAAELDPTELAQLKGSDPRKVALARHIWERTAVSQGWLAKHLQMGSAANVSQQIRRAKFTSRALPKDLKRFLESVKN